MKRKTNRQQSLKLPQFNQIQSLGTNPTPAFIFCAYDSLILNLLVFYCIIIVHNLYSPARHLFLAMPPPMSLPPDVLQTIPWEESDLSSVVLTCRLFHQLFTPRLYDNFTAEADYLDLRYPGLDFPRFLFLRTIRTALRWHPLSRISLSPL